jgi:hypothetical protein
VELHRSDRHNAPALEKGEYAQVNGDHLLRVKADNVACSLQDSTKCSLYSPPLLSKMPEIGPLVLHNFRRSGGIKNLRSNEIPGASSLLLLLGANIETKNGTHSAATSDAVSCAASASERPEQSEQCELTSRNERAETNGVQSKAWTFSHSQQGQRCSSCFFPE